MSLSRLRSALQEKNYYDAHQIYIASHHKFQKQNQLDKSLTLLAQGISVLNRSGHPPLSFDLCKVVLDDIFSNYSPNQKIQINKNVPEKSAISWFIEDVLEKETKDWKIQIKVDLLEEALKWTSKTQKCTFYHGMTQGHPLIHYKYAMLCWKERNQYMDAHKQFCRAYISEGLDGEEEISYYNYIDENSVLNAHVELLTEWSSHGFDSEKDLFIVRAVLHLVSSKKLTVAKNVFRLYLASYPDLDTPLVHFTKFLLLSMDKKNPHLFRYLQSKYEPFLKRDQSFIKLIGKGGEMYLNIRSAQSSGGGLSGIFSSLFGGSK